MNDLITESMLREIRRSMDYWRIPGAVIGVLYRDRPAEIHCLGFRDAEAGIAMDADTRFCMASVSKSFTAALVSILCDKGLIDMDRPISEMVPELVFGEGRPVSLRDMLSHRTGLANHDALWPGDRTKAEIAGQIRYLGYNLPFRTRYQYNNLLYIMAGYACEAVTGKSYSGLLREYLFDPIGMKTASSTEREIRGSGDMAVPYQVFGTERKRLRFWNMDMAAPAAGVNASVKDMLRWVGFQLRGGVTEDGTRLISPERFADMHRIQILFSDMPLVEDSHFVYHGYNMGWRTATYREVEMQLHTGKIEGYSSIQAYVPEDDIGFAIMMNLHSPSDAFFGGIIFDVLDRVIYGEESDWTARLRGSGEYAGPEEYSNMLSDDTPQGFCGNARPFEEAICAEMLRSSSAPGAGGTDGTDISVRQPDAAQDVLPEKNTDLVGDYFNPGYGAIRIFQRGGALLLHYRDQDLELHPVGEGRFYMDGVKEDTWTIRVPVWTEPEKRTVRILYEKKLPPIAFVRTDV